MIALQPWEPLSRFQTHHGDCSRAQDLLGLQGTFPSMRKGREVKKSGDLFRVPFSPHATSSQGPAACWPGDNLEQTLSPTCSVFSASISSSSRK